jgi:hypothetical protein
MTLLGASAVAVSHTGNTNETALATVTIPAGAMGLNGGLLIYATWTYTNSSNNKTPRIRLGGIGGTVYANLVLTTTATYHDIRRIRNRGAANSQLGGQASAASQAIGSTTSAPVTGAIDTSVTQDLVFSGQLALGSETIALEGYEVWLLP